MYTDIRPIFHQQVNDLFFAAFWRQFYFFYCSLYLRLRAEGCPSLFGWFTGTAAQSDFSGTCMSAVRLMAFADRP
jgi:hypothetical protein